MINNFDIFQRDFKEGTFYFVQILLRGKDLGITINGDNKVRLLKAYYIHTKEELEGKKQYMIDYANLTGARIYVHPSKRDTYKISLELLSYVADMINYNTNSRLYRCYETVCGRNKGTERIWIIDIDTKDFGEVERVRKLIESIRPNKLIYQILETKNGYHILSSPFDKSQWKEKREIQTNNPTVLYIPWFGRELENTVG